MKKWNEMKIMGEMSQIYDFDGVKKFVKAHGSQIKKAIMPLVVILAMAGFWTYGGQEPELTVEDGAAVGGEYAETADGESTEAGEPAGQPTAETAIYVDIGGEVVNPGVYQVKAGTRLFQVVEQAGGLKDSADTDSINQAEAVMDGQKIIIGSRDADSPYYTGWSGTAAKSQNGTNAQRTESAVRETDSGYIVNINLASLQELQLLPGVGPSTAQKILDYRSTNGPFQKIQDIKKISGIGDKTFENLKEYIEC